MIIYSPTGATLLDVMPDDNSYRHRAIMGDNALTLYFSLAQHVEIPVGAYCEHGGEHYTLMRPEALKMQHTRHFDYTIELEGEQGKMSIWKIRNPIDGRLRFSLTARPKEHLQMLVDNLNRRDSGWTVGECIESAERVVNYEHAFCRDALALMAKAFDTEYEIVGKRISLGAVEHDRANALPLSYGKGNGFVSGVARTNSEDSVPTEILYVQGGERNIDRSKYGASTLHLPLNVTIGFDGARFEGETGYDARKARRYRTDEKGFAVQRADRPLSSKAEDSVDLTDIYPSRVGTVAEVITANEQKHFYDFTDPTIPETLDFEKCLIAGEKMTVIFQSGMLSGREFEVKYAHAASGKKARRFEIVPQEIDGQTMPGGAFVPRVRDKYAVFHCMLPQAYINDTATRSGAEWDLLRKAVKHLYSHEDPKFSFTGTLDGIWAKRNWANVGGRLKIGAFILFSDKQFQPEGVAVRIVGIKDYINTPHSPEIELSNAPVSSSFGTTLKALESAAVAVEEKHREALQYSKRRFRDAQETAEMIGAALSDRFTNAISPAAVQTMSLLVGDESLQFRFVGSRTNPTAVPHVVAYNAKTKTVNAASGILQHLTLGIRTVSAEHSPSEYRFWDVAAFTSGRLDDAAKKYYLYVRAPRNGNRAEFVLKESPVGFESDAANYHLLVGVLNSEYDGDRSFAPLYGFSEVLPGRITTDRVATSDGRSFFDLAAGEMRLGDSLVYQNGRLSLRGTLVQNEGGVTSPLACYRGEWNATTTYYNGDEVRHTDAEGVVSTYRYIGERPSSGAPLTDKTKWTISASGVKGTNGRGIERVVSFYLLSADSSAPAVSARGWVTAPPKPKKQEPYLWSYDKIYYTDRTSEQTAVRLLAQLGKDGADGLPTRPNLLDGTDFKSAGAWEGYASSKHAKFHTIWRWSPPAISGCNPMGTELFDDIEEGGYSQFSQVLRFDLVEGRSYTFSVYARGVDSGWLIVEPNDGTRFRLVAAKWGEWTRYSVTFRARKPKPGEETRVYLRNWTKDIVRGKKQVVVFCAPKLEEGTEATPWCPSRNDLRGDPGKSSYTHVAYSNSPDGNPCTLDPKGEKFAYLGTYTDENKDASRDPARYVWAKVQGDKGDNGRGVSRMRSYYMLTTERDAPQHDTFGWTETAPQPTKERPWLWSYERSEYTDGDADQTVVRLIGHYGKDGTNGTSIRAQYSADARTWHDDFAEGDVWMRTGNGTTWGGALRVVGESGTDGKSPVYDFAASSQLATASGTTAPTIRGMWQDAPPTLRDGEVLWYRLTAANGKITYGRLSGEKGTSIRAQYSADAQTWHDDFAAGDVWMRTGNGTTWGGALRVVGESGADGKSPVYDFAASSQLATASGTTAPTIRGTWQDAPPTLRDGEVLWYRLTAANGKITYGRLSGRNSYIHIAYANSEDGAKDFTLEEDLGRGGEIEFSYFGIYADFDESASQDNHDYVWTRLRGVDGKDGLTPNANLLDDTDFKNLGRKESAWSVGAFGEEPLGGRANADLFPPSVSGCYPALCSINPGTKQGEFAQLWQNIGRLIPGRTYTFSVYVRGASDAWLIVHPNPSEHFRPNTVKPDEWTRVSLTFTAPKTKATEDTLILLRAWHREEQPHKGFAKNVVWCAPKLEEGGIPTPWNPSRNDLRGNDGAPGARGAVVRQLGDYAKLPDGTAFESGHAGETFQDVVQVRQGAQVQFYQCKQPHTKSADKAPAADSEWWELGMYQGFIATDLLLTERSLIKNLQVENVVGRDANGNTTFDLDASTGTAYFGGTATFAGFIRRRPVVITPDNWEQYGGVVERGVIYLNPFRVGTYVIFRGNFGTLRPTINTGGAPLNDGAESVTPDDSQAMRYYGAQFMVFNDLEPRPTTFLTVGGLTIGSKQTAIFTMKGRNHADPSLWWHGELLQRW